MVADIQKGVLLILKMLPILSLLAMKGDPGTSWHLSPKESITIRNLVKLICDLTKKQLSKVL